MPPITLGLDLGTTSTAAVAVSDGRTIATSTHPTPPRLPSAANRAEFDADALVAAGIAALRDLSAQLTPGADIAGLGLTGQQHGVVVMDVAARRAVTPFVNWQDRRGLDDFEAGRSWLDEARHRVGETAYLTTGCRLSAGYMALTLFRLIREGLSGENLQACFVTDYAASMLTGRDPMTEASMAGSAGVFDLRLGAWNPDMLRALEVPATMMPDVMPAGTVAGRLSASMAAETGLPEGLPVAVGIGDNQAAFLGAVADREAGVLVNVGTGGQVAQWSAEPSPVFDVEARPFPGGGYLHVSAGLVGGAAYAVFERFIRLVGEQVFGVTAPEAVFERLNALAEAVGYGDSPTCEPFFLGTRRNPDARGSWRSLTADNLTPGHLTRSVLNGIAGTLSAARRLVEARSGREATVLYGAGNGVRENALLARLIAEGFELPMSVAEREEAARGAASQALAR